MDDFESVYLHDDFDGNDQKLRPMDRLKIGEVFQIRQNQFAFVCIHCSKEFQVFNRFTAHIQIHYQNVLQWLTTNKNETSQAEPTESVDANHEEVDVEWLFSDSSNDTQTLENGAENIQQLIQAECGSQSNESEVINENLYENDESQSLETRFKLKHPLIRVNATNESRKLLPYLSKKYQFKRTADHRFKCPTCESLFSSKAGVREHIFTHSESKIFSCKICDKEFSRPRNLREHIEQKHNEVSISMPDKAPKKLKIERIDSFGNVNETNVLISPKIKIDSKTLYSADVNGDKSRSQCYICQKSFSRPNGIVKHMKVHTQEKNYQCFTCGAQFGRSDHLNRHMLIHEDPKFKCDICDLTFRRSDKLLAHRRKHPDTMNYTCESCGLGFMELSSIKTHIGFHCKGRLNPISTTTELSITQPIEDPVVDVEFQSQNNHQSDCSTSSSLKCEKSQ